MTTTTKRTAAEAYEQNHAKAVDLLDQIRCQLHDLPAPDGEVEIRWSHVCTVAEANRQLSEIFAFLES